MIICLCGNEKSKVLNELKQVYKDKLIVFNYYHTAFRTIVETESVRYKLEAECKSLEDAKKLYSEYVTDKKFIIYNAPKKLFDDFISFIE